MDVRSRPVVLMAFSLTVGLILAGVGSAQLIQADTTPSSLDWVEADYDMTLGPDLLSVALVGTALVHSLDPADYEEHCGNVCTADTLREVYHVGSESDRQEMVSILASAAADRARRSLVALAGPDGAANVTAVVQVDTLASEAVGDPHHPPVLIHIAGSAVLAPGVGLSATTDELDAYLRMGARFDLPVEERVDPGYNLSLSFAVPAPLAIVGTADGASSADGASVTWTIQNWLGTAPVPLTDVVAVSRRDVVVPDQESADITVILDLSQIEVHYTNLVAGGEMATVHVRMAVDAKLDAIAVPMEVPEGVVLPALSADAIRVGLDEGILQESDLEMYGARASFDLAVAFSGSFGEGRAVEGGFDPATLSMAALGSPLGTGGPITFYIETGSSLSFPPADDASGVPAVTIARIPLPDRIELPAVDVPGDLPATYQIILPAGMDVEFENIDGSQVEHSVTPDGRRVLSVQGDASEGQAVALSGATLVVGHEAIVHMMWPILLALFLIFVVLPGTFIYAVVRKRRRRRLASASAREARAAQRVPNDNPYEPPRGEPTEDAARAAEVGDP